MIGAERVLAIYMDGALDQPFGKMGAGVLRYSPNAIAAVVDSQLAGRRVSDVLPVPRDCPIVATLDEARALGADTLVLGIAPPGGLIPASWYAELDLAVALGFSLVNGLHDLLGPRYPGLPPGQFVWDIRIEPEGLVNGTGRAGTLPGCRVLMVGSDMAIGKMTAGLEIHRTALERGLRSAFVATGQIGITVLGSGVPLDAVRVDYASGAVEREMMRWADAELIVVEGQGSILHPSSTATLPLIRGSVPTHFVLCHRAGQETLLRMPEIRIPPRRELIRLYEDIAEACGTFPRPRTVAIALNTAHLSDSQAREACARESDATGLPCLDPIRDGADALVDAVLS